MWLQQKDYAFNIDRDSVSKDDSLSNINLKVNGKLTTVKLEQLFLKISEHEFLKNGKILTVRGWSILQQASNGKLLIADNEVSISFFDESLGDLSIGRIVNPWCQMNDKELSNENVKEIYDKIIELSTTQEVSTETETLDEKVDKAAEEVVVPQHQPSVLITNKLYESGKKPYLRSGYKEYEFENFRLLLKDKKALLIELIDSAEMKQYKDANLLAPGFYQFIDANNQRKINAKVIDEKLSIDFITDEINTQANNDNLEGVNLPEESKAEETTSQ